MSLLLFLPMSPLFSQIPAFFCSAELQNLLPFSAPLALLYHRLSRGLRVLSLSLHVIEEIGVPFCGLLVLLIKQVKVDLEGSLRTVLLESERKTIVGKWNSQQLLRTSREM